MAIDPKKKARFQSLWFFVGGMGLAAMLVAGGVVWLMVPRAGVSRQSGASAPVNAGDPASWEKWELDGGTTGQKRVVELAYYEPLTDGWATQKQSIVLPDQDSGKLATVVQVWLDGASRSNHGPLVPRNTTLLNAFIVGGRRAYLDFSPEFAQPAGITAEVERVGGLAKTIRANFPSVTDMQILVSGTVADTLSGQLAIAAPLRVSYFADIVE